MIAAIRLYLGTIASVTSTAQGRFGLKQYNAFKPNFFRGQAVMVLTNPTTPSARALADQLLAEQDVIRRYVERMNELRSRILACEEKFGIPSTEIHEAIESGQLHETLEVCEWIIDYELLSRAKSIGQ